MSRKAIREYFKAIYARYRKASREIKQIILNEFCSNTGYNRKYAIRKLNGPTPAKTDTVHEGNIPTGRRLYRFCQLYGGSKLSLFSKIKSLDKTLAAMDTETISAQAADRETIAFDQRPSDNRQKAQKQESSNWQTHVWADQTGDPAEASYSYKD
jgi:hypothetical protein